jgi:hypothetical protein
MLMEPFSQCLAYSKFSIYHDDVSKVDTADACEGMGGYKLRSDLTVYIGLFFYYGRLKVDQS